MCHKHFQVTFPLTKTGTKGPDLQDWLRQDRQTDGWRGREGTGVGERWGEEDDEEFIWDHWPNHEAQLSFHLCHLCPQSTEDPVPSTVRKACSTRQSELLAVYCKGTFEL